MRSVSLAQPASQQCSVLNSAGRVAGADVSTIRVLCEGFPLSGFGAPVYFKASNTGRFDWFGHALAMSGNTLAVGAPFEDKQWQRPRRFGSGRWSGVRFRARPERLEPTSVSQSE